MGNKQTRRTVQDKDVIVYSFEKMGIDVEKYKLKARTQISYNKEEKLCTIVDVADVNTVISSARRLINDKQSNWKVYWGDLKSDEKYPLETQGDFEAMMLHFFPDYQLVA